MDESTAHPFLARPVTGINGAVATLRSLKSEDASSFGEFLEALSAETRERYSPHPLDRTEAERICAALDDPTALRFVLADAHDDRVVAYLLAQFVIPEGEKARYRNLECAIEDGADCRIAPVVADHLQGNGLGTELLKGALGILRQRGCRHVILFGGTRTSNAQAIRAYEKAGFKPAGVFRERGIESVDMWLSLK
ncbi:GNAT family N-acetyltransferase [Streptomyces sp. NBC_01244]|uniref:GNAT family N-acetyltransferase n=1 Tax=Streptomyces sp. NBC_01244 TaxID=2903797 RepID=UPI002E0D8D89|nr:GNAT family N-acetyltransferase [Streptomyces sp. NBC_01244]